MTDHERESKQTPSGGEEETIRLDGSDKPASGATIAAQLQPNQILADRFRIVRFIAHGGMGSVYEADDLELQERVALKTVRPDIAADGKSIERFKREIRLARKVTHPNVCRIYDVFNHQGESAQADMPAAVTFLAMELLRGETVQDRLRRVGRLTTDEAYPILAQMVDALSAAHDAGIIHRDFKSANVMLVPSSHNEAELRTVVTDFGLASHLSAETAATRFTGTGSIVGTPDYMSPEQVEDGEITAATDIYALGIVIYEMLTGAFPFVGNTALSGLIKRLKDAPESPRTHLPDLDPKWEAVILRCLEREPERRFARAADVMTFLDGGAAGAKLHQTRPIWKRPPLMAAAAVVLFLLALLGYQFSSYQLRPNETGLDPPRPPPPVVISSRPSVAILGFKNLSGKDEVGWLSTALSEMLSSELAAGEELLIIPGENVERMKINLALRDSDTLASDTLGQIRDTLGATFVVQGSYLALGTEAPIQIILSLQETKEGETLDRISEKTQQAKLTEFVSQIGDRLREKLGIDLSPDEEEQVVAARPKTPQAARFYSQGLQKLRVYDALSAEGLLSRAVKANPRNPLFHSALSVAWSRLGEDAKATEEAKKAFELSAKLPRGERLSVEARYRETTSEWDKAIQLYTTLVSDYPDQLDYGLRMAEAQISFGKADKARITAAQLRRLPRSLSEDPRIDLVDAQAAEALSDWPTQKGLASTAADKAGVHGSRLVVARAQLLEGTAHRKLGDFESARRSFEEAKTIYQDAGDVANMAFAMNAIAQLLTESGSYADAKTMHEKALQAQEEAGDQAGLATTVDSLAKILSEQGDMDSVRKLYEEKIAARSMARGKGARLAKPMNNMALAFKQKGELDKAARLYERGLDFYRKSRNLMGTAQALMNLSQIVRLQGKLSEARVHAEEALKIWNLLDQKRPSSLCRLGLAALANDEKRFQDAQAILNKLVPVFRSTKRFNEHATALNLVARSALGKGDTNEASQAIDRAFKIKWRRGNHELRLTLSITRARMLATKGRSTQAMRSLEAILQDARKSNLLVQEFDSRLALGETELRSGKVSAGTARLEKLEQETALKGFGLFAQKASQLR